jgi:hypothetical protein
VSWLFVADDAFMGDSAALIMDVAAARDDVAGLGSVLSDDALPAEGVAMWL